MVIKNKIEGYKKREELNLNRFHEGLFHKGEIEKVEGFLNKYNVEYYAVRSINIVGYKLSIKVPRDLVVDEIANHNSFTLSVSSHNYTDNLLLIGDVKIETNNNVWLWASKKEYPKGKDKTPDYNLCTDIFDKKLSHIKGFNDIYKYVIDKNLINVIVEFAVYDKAVGINNETVVVFEIRTDY